MNSDFENFKSISKSIESLEKLNIQYTINGSKFLILNKNNSWIEVAETADNLALFVKGITFKF